LRKELLRNTRFVAHDAWRLKSRLRLQMPACAG